jgi:hypothetical protein
MYGLDEMSAEDAHPGECSRGKNRIAFIGEMPHKKVWA